MVGVRLVEFHTDMIGILRSSFKTKKEFLRITTTEIDKYKEGRCEER
jgi:hypothetical protein